MRVTDPKYPNKHTHTHVCESERELPLFKLCAAVCVDCRKTPTIDRERFVCHQFCNVGYSPIKSPTHPKRGALGTESEAYIYRSSISAATAQHTQRICIRQTAFNEHNSFTYASHTHTHRMPRRRIFWAAAHELYTFVHSYIQTSGFIER